MDDEGYEDYISAIKESMSTGKEFYYYLEGPFIGKKSRMTRKELFLQIKSYQEFDKRRDEFAGLKIDKEVLKHMAELFPKVSNTKKELSKYPPSKER